MRPAPQSEASDYELVGLRNGTASLRSKTYGETLHPGVGPRMEGEALYARQLRIPERLAACSEPFVIWDVGLGAAANAISVLQATKGVPGNVHLISFDQTLAPLQFALAHSKELEYVQAFESLVEVLIARSLVEFANGYWEIHVCDFPALLREGADAIPKPHAILFDPFSPAKNPEMWTASLFTDLFRSLDPARPCALATFSRSTMIRVALLLAGFYVGSGLATGEKEETTIAANRPELLDNPLGSEWLLRAKRSGSAEPLWSPIYRKKALSPATWENLKAHRQFR